MRGGRDGVGGGRGHDRRGEPAPHDEAQSLRQRKQQGEDHRDSGYIPYILDLGEASTDLSTKWRHKGYQNSLKLLVQSSAKLTFPGLVNFVPAFVYHCS